MVFLMPSEAMTAEQDRNINAKRYEASFSICLLKILLLYYFTGSTLKNVQLSGIAICPTPTKKS